MPPGRMALTCKLVFKRKRDAQGRVCRYRIRLVVQGYLQKFGVDYDETFAPVVDFEVVLLIVSYFCALTRTSTTLTLSPRF